MAQFINKKYVYPRIRVRGPDGRIHYSAGAVDAISKAMFGMTYKQLIEVMDQNNLRQRLERHLPKRIGHFKMILGQTLRARVRAGQTVTVRGVRVVELDQPMPWPTGYKQEKIKRKIDAAPSGAALPS